MNRNGQLLERRELDVEYWQIQTVKNEQAQAVKTVSAGDSHCLAIAADGSLWSWGSNKYGQLGDGTYTYTNCNTVTEIGSAKDWAVVAAGGNQSAAIKKDGSLWVWGGNLWGQLGDGTINNRNIPRKISGANDWALVSASYGHTAAIKTDGSLWTWGSNDYGQLGDGTNTSRNTPTKIHGADDWAVVSVGDRYSAAKKEDGSLWAWGANWYGQLGNGTYLNENSPIKIISGTTP